MIVYNVRMESEAERVLFVEAVAKHASQMAYEVVHKQCDNDPLIFPGDKICLTLEFELRDVKRPCSANQN